VRKLFVLVYLNDNTAVPIAEKGGQGDHGDHQGTPITVLECVAMLVIFQVKTVGAILDKKDAKLGAAPMMSHVEIPAISPFVRTLTADYTNKSRNAAKESNGQSPSE